MYNKYINIWHAMKSRFINMNSLLHACEIKYNLVPDKLTPINEQKELLRINND